MNTVDHTHAAIISITQYEAAQYHSDIAAARAAVPQLLSDVDALQAERDALAAELAKWRQKYMSSSESWPDTIPYDESEPGGWPKSIPVVEPFQD